MLGCEGWTVFNVSNKCETAFNIIQTDLAWIECDDCNLLIVWYEYRAYMFLFCVLQRVCCKQGSWLLAKLENPHCAFVVSDEDVLSPSRVDTYWSKLQFLGTSVAAFALIRKRLVKTFSDIDVAVLPPVAEMPPNEGWQIARNCYEAFVTLLQHWVLVLLKVKISGGVIAQPLYVRNCFEMTAVMTDNSSF